MKTRLFSLAALIVLLMVSACVTPAPTFTPVPIVKTFLVASPTPSITGSITVFASSSLTDAFLELGRSFQNDHPGTTIYFNFAAPGQLTTMIGQGRPADLYASNSVDQFKTVVAAGNIEGDGTIFARDRLVVIALNSAGKVKSLKDLAAPGVNIVVAGPLDPLRDYTMTLWDNLTKVTDYGAGYKDAVLNNGNSQEDNSRQVLGKILQGGADAGIVFVTDVMTPEISAKVYQILIPDNQNVIATYMIGLLKASNNKDLARLFMGYVLSQPGQDILRKWAFLPISSN